MTTLVFTPEDAIADTALPAAAALGTSDILVVSQAGADARTTLGAATVLVRKTPAGSRTPTAFPATITLTAADHDKNVVLTGTTGVLTVDGTITDGFRCHVINNASGVATYSGITGLLSTTSLAAGLASTIMMAGATVYASAGGGSAPATPVLTMSSISGQAPGGTSTASLTFANGAPASLTATLDGAGLTIGSIVVTTTAGAGATASGTASFTFTTPAAGTHSIVATGTGTYAASSATYTLVTSASPILTTTGVSPVGVGLTATATMSFANGAPTGLTATMDGGALTIAGVSITTTSGTGASATGTASFTFTNPAAGSHALVVTGTGTYAATAASYGYSTAALAITVNTITAPAPSTTFAVSGTYSNFTPAGLQYSTDSGTTWTTASSPTISGGTYTLSVTGGLAAGTYTVQVRGTVQTGTIGTSNSFTIVAVGGTITAPGSSTVNVAASFPITITGSGNPSVWASITSGGVEGTRVQASYGATSVSLTPVNTTAGQTASLYAASSGGTALATSASFTPAAAAASLLVDTLAVAPYGAYSMTRQLRGAYAGAAFRVRRSSDNTEMDIPFLNGVVDTSAGGTLVSFVGTSATSQGYVVKIYNQIAGGVDLAQATAANQFKCVSNGGVILQGTKLAFNPYAGGTVLSAPSIAASTTALAYSIVGTQDGLGVEEIGALSGNTSAVYQNANAIGLGNNNPTSTFAMSKNAVYNSVNASGGAHVYHGEWDSVANTIQTFVDNVGATPATVSGVLTGPLTLYFGADSSSASAWKNNLCEIIVQPSVNASDRTAIYNNQKAFYGTP